MSSRIPSSLKWLIDKRARLDAEIKKTQASLAKTRRLIKELSDLKETLEAIDLALGMHEIKVDIECIQPLRSHYAKINLPYGELTRSILARLRSSGGTPVKTTSIIAFVEERYVALNIPPENRAKLARSVHYRLKDLARGGVLLRHHDPYSNTEGLWSINQNHGDEA